MTQAAAEADPSLGEAPLTSTEVDKLNVELTAMLASRAPGGRRAAPKPKPAEARGRRNGRRALGLAPGGAGDREASGESLDLGARGDPVIALISQSGELLLSLIEDTRRHFESKIAALQVENAGLSAKLAEAQAKVGELAFVQERLQLSRRGPPGHPGPRGADGPPGVRGERGAKGEPGGPAPVIAAWEPNPSRFEVTPRFSNGETGPPICMLSLFQAYDSAVQDRDDDDIVEAAARSRACNEAEVQAKHWAR